MTEMAAPKQSSTSMVIRELRRFLESTAPEVICIRGRWGVGKTYAWNTALKEAAKDKKIALGSYSYVSLFGITNLDQLKYSIFENRTTGAAIAHDADNKSLTKNFSDTVNSFAPKVLEAITGKGGTEIVQAAAFMSIRNQIICIDDIERKGETLLLRDVLGLVSMLSERRNCKVVIILNDEQLDEEKDWTRYNEKVIERSLLYFPTCEEAVGIALQDNKLLGPQLAPYCIRLDISNIRVVKRIERLASQLHPLFIDYDAQIFQSYLKTIALLGWAHFSEFDRNAESSEKQRDHLIAFILKRHGAALYGGTNTKGPEEERWEALLKMYDFGMADEGDLLLNEGILNGYFNEARLIELAKKATEDLKRHKATQAWSKTWDLFHGSFDDNAEKFLSKLERSFKQALNVVTPIDVDTMVRTLKQFGRSEIAQDLLARFVARRGKSLSDFNLDTYVFRDRISDPDVVAAFARLSASGQVQRPAEEILIHIYTNHSWDASDVTFLAQLDAQDYVRIFKMPLGDDHRRVVTAALGFGKFVNPEPNYVAIASKATEALRIIANESTLNRLRVRAFIQLDGEKESSGDDA